MKKVTLLILSIVIFSCQEKYPGVPDTYNTLLDSAMVKAGTNSIELKKALEEAPLVEKKGMAFLISYMPERDLKSLSAKYLLNNTQYAYKARKKFPWANQLPDSIFLNEVLPYANISEDRDDWRKDFYNRFKKYAEGKTDVESVVLNIAKNIAKELNVAYNTKRSKVDISPLQAIEEHMATCTGLSILLTNAYRSVGIPSRLAGTPMWTNFSGNHTWSEVWINGKWHFIEYYPDGLNKAWFLGRAGKADPEHMLHWIYAASFKPTNLPYYAAVDAPYIMQKIDLDKLPKTQLERFAKRKEKAQDLEPYLWGHNVTERYITLYKESIKNKSISENECILNLVVFNQPDTQNSDSRLKCRIEIFKDDKLVDYGYSPRKTDDMNQSLQIKLKKNTAYKIKVTHHELNLGEVYPFTTAQAPNQEKQIIL